MTSLTSHQHHLLYYDVTNLSIMTSLTSHQALYYDVTYYDVTSALFVMSNTCTQGGVLLVSHDFRLISQVAEEIWVCEHETVTKWDGDILSYKAMLRAKFE